MRIGSTCIAVFLTLFLLPPSSWATDYFVDQSGAGSGNGSSYANRMSIANYNSGNLDSSTSPGDTIYFCGSFTTAPNTTEGGSGANQLIFDGDCDSQGGTDATFTDGMTIDQQYITIQNSTIKSDNCDWNGAITLTANADYAIIQDNTITESENFGIAGQSTTLTNVQILNNTISFVNMGGIAICGDDHLIEGNDISRVDNDYNDCTTNTAQADGMFIGESGTCEADRITIRGNWIHDILKSDMRGGTVPHVDCIQTSGSSTQDGVVEYNHCYNGNTSTPDLNEHFTSNDTFVGMMHEGGTGWTIRYNIFESCGGITLTSNSDNTSIYGNIIRGSRSHTGGYSPTGLSHDSGVTGTVLRNNIFFDHGTTSDGEIIVVSAVGTHTDNIFFRTDDSNVDPGYVLDASETEDTNPNLSDDSLNGNFWPTAGSIAIDTGYDMGTSGNADDGLPTTYSWPGDATGTLAQDSYGSGWEIGAYVFEPSTGTIQGVTIDTDGTTLTITFSEAVSQGSGYDDDDLNVDCTLDGDNLTISYSSGDGTDTHVYILTRSVADDKWSNNTCDLDFNGDSNSLENGSGVDLEAVTDESITNNSVKDPAPYRTYQIR